jgi:hypothetical protein
VITSRDFGGHLAGGAEHGMNSEPPIPRPWPAHPHSRIAVSRTLRQRTAV